MQICDFAYIKFADSNDNLINKIENFYIVNDKQATLNHVKLVSETNINIAKQYGLSIEKCYLSALLHDISSAMKPDDMIIYATNHKIILDDSEKKYPFLLHQQISSFMAKEVFNVIDKDVLSAIACHTTLKSNPNKYDLALFIADKLSWDQDGIPPFFEAVSNSLLYSLESASLQYINYMLENNLILYPHKWFNEAKMYLDSLQTK